MQFIRALQEQMPNALIVNQLEGRRSFRLDQRFLNKGMEQSPSLESFVGITQSAVGIPFRLKDYLELVDWSGRIIREGKRGHIQENAPPILRRLALNTEAWRILTTKFESRFQCWVGSEHIVKRVYEDNGYQRNPPTQSHRTLFG